MPLFPLRLSSSFRYLGSLPYLPTQCPHSPMYVSLDCKPPKNRTTSKCLVIVSIQGVFVE